MKLSEPVTAITDFILTGESIVLASILMTRSNGRLSVLLWTFAFLALATGSLTGGFFHGLRHKQSPCTTTRLWRITAFSLLTGFLLFVAGGVASVTRGSLRTCLLIACAFAACLVALWTARREGRTTAVGGLRLWILLILISLSLLLARQVLAQGASSGIYILIGSWICLVGIGVQQTSFRLGKQVNQNDICHLLFMPGLYFLYLGGVSL